MLAKISAALAAGVAAAFSTMGSVGRWGFQFARGVVRLPFELLGGSPSPPPYEPQVSGVDLLDEYNDTQKRLAAVHTLDRDGVDTVLRYVRAMPQARPTMDLSGVSKDVQVTLATMDDHELTALKNGGLSAVRNFVEGKPSVHGVPCVVKAPPKAANDEPATMSVQERDLWKATAQYRRRTESKGFSYPRP